MISPMVFNEAIQELELMFGLIEQDRARRDNKINIYYDRLKFTSERILSKAVKHLIDVHVYKRFPLVGEVRDAITQVATAMPESRLENKSLVVCEVCHGTGHAIKDKVGENGYQHAVAMPCQCYEGRRVEARWQTYNEKRKQGG